MKNSLFPIFKKKEEKKKGRKKKAFAFVFFFLILFPFVLFFHQNCGPQFPSSSFYGGKKEQFSIFVPPFAYDTEIDTLSFMSCTGLPESHITNAFYHFKVGSYKKKSGIRLTQEFLDETEGMEEEKIVSLLQDKDIFNARLKLQLSLRSLSNVQRNVVSLTEKPEEGSNFHHLFVPLDANTVAKELLKLKKTERMNVLHSLPLFQKERFLIGSLYFGPLKIEDRLVSGEEILNFFRGKLQTTELLLTLTYSRFMDEKHLNQAVPFFKYFNEYVDHIVAKKEEKEGTELLDDLDDLDNLDDEESENLSAFGTTEMIDVSRAQGTGFQLSFKAGGSLKTIGNEQFMYLSFDEHRALSHITEIDLRTGRSKERVWSCGSFMVVQSKDNREPEEEAREEEEDQEEVEERDRVDDLRDSHFSVFPLCPEGEEDPRSSDPMYQALRAVLSKESWSINMKYRCVVPKTSYDLCYYSEGERSFRESKKFKVNYFGHRCGKDTTKWDCPHYVSVCYAEASYSSP